MAKGMYIGVNNVARKVSKMHIGVNGVARKVKKAYIGVNGVAKEFYTSIVTWNGGTDAEIAAMVEAADNGLINLADYWSVGDERTVSLSAMSSTYVGESHAAQNVVMVLMDTNKYDLVNATSGGKTKCDFAVGMKDCLNEYGYMNNSNTNAGSWHACARRNWCNNVFHNAIPSTLRSIFKQFKTPTIKEYNGRAITYSNDYFALWAEKEIVGSRYFSNTTEANVLSQISYYTTSSHRIKKASGSAYYWWERSPYYSDSSYFCRIDWDGSVYYHGASNNIGISPFGCI